MITQRFFPPGYSWSCRLCGSVHCGSFLSPWARGLGAWQLTPKRTQKDPKGMQIPMIHHDPPIIDLKILKWIEMDWWTQIDGHTYTHRWWPTTVVTPSWGGPKLPIQLRNQHGKSLVLLVCCDDFWILSIANTSKNFPRTPKACPEATEAQPKSRTTKRIHYPSLSFQSETKTLLQNRDTTSAGSGGGTTSRIVS